MSLFIYKKFGKEQWENWTRGLKQSRWRGAIKEVKQMKKLSHRYSRNEAKRQILST